jgi:hypothetical protein
MVRRVIALLVLALLMMSSLVQARGVGDKVSSKNLAKVNAVSGKQGAKVSAKAAKISAKASAKAQKLSGGKVPMMGVGAMLP